MSQAVTNCGKLWFACVRCLKRLAFDPAAAPADQPSACDPSVCRGCAFEATESRSEMDSMPELVAGWSGL